MTNSSKRFAFLGALALVGLLALPGGAALARDHDHDRGGDRGGDRGRWERHESYRDEGRYSRPDPDRGRYGPPAYAPPAYAPYAPRGYPAPYAAPSAWRRGQYLPPSYWGGDVGDPRRLHLRAPPPGYGWVAVGRDVYLIQRSTGLVLDTVPGAW